MALNWIDKVDGVDDVVAEDINGIARAVIESEEAYNDINAIFEDAGINSKITLEIGQEGKYINRVGNVATAAGYAISKPIEVGQGRKIKFTANGKVTAVYIDEDNYTDAQKDRLDKLNRSFRYMTELVAPQDIYYLALGINDAHNLGADYLGTIADIKEDCNQNADTFYGNYGKIISKIKEYAPNAKMVMFTIVERNTSEYEQIPYYNTAIIEMDNHFGIPYIVQTDDGFFNSDFYKNGEEMGHHVAVVYSGMANAFERLLKQCIVDNFDYFKDAYKYDEVDTYWGV